VASGGFVGQDTTVGAVGGVVGVSLAGDRRGEQNPDEDIRRLIGDLTGRVTAVAVGLLLA
jgi:hypothetical protein